MNIEPQYDHELAIRTDEERYEAIRALLASGPLTKWQMREQLHEPETVILKSLTVLRRAGEIKAFIVSTKGSLNSRAWALVTYQRFVAARKVKKAAEPEPGESWWLTVPPDRFTAQCAERSRR
jgi:hypothetical protein